MPLSAPLRRRLTRILRRPAAAQEVLELRAELAELRHEHDRIAEAHRAKSAFLSGLSHQLRTPLNSILLYSELLGEDLQARGAGDLGADLERIQEAGRHLLGLIDDILDLSRLEAGRMTFDLKTIDIPGLTADLAALLEGQARRQGNRLQLQLPAGLGGLRTDPRKLSQILFNLLENALKFTRDGQITLRVEPLRPRAIRFSVVDDGPGMEPEQVARIREEFERTEASETPRFGNAGLGLTLCRRLAEGLGGTLKVDSRPGQGSTFSLTLPRAGKAQP
jgi:signal transduction histidine kinase